MAHDGPGDDPTAVYRPGPEAPRSEPVSLRKPGVGDDATAYHPGGHDPATGQQGFPSQSYPPPGQAQQGYGQTVAYGGAGPYGGAPSPGQPTGYGPPQGYGAPQGYGQPPGYGQPAGYGGYPQPAYGRYPGVPAPTNTLAILSLVMIFIFTPLALVFGLIARKQIRDTGENGDGMALAGIIVGGISIAFFVLLIVFLIIVAAASL